MTNTLKLNYEHAITHKFRVLIDDSLVQGFRKHLDEVMGRHTFTICQETRSDADVVQVRDGLMAVLYLETNHRGGKKLAKAIRKWGQS